MAKGRIATYSYLVKMSAMVTSHNFDQKTGIYTAALCDGSKITFEEAGIELPRMYKMGYLNNNCAKTGCVQGGLGYWQKISIERPEVFDEMARVEHELTDLKGEPVTMLRDQAKGGGLLFLKPHPKYPHIKDISMKRTVEVRPLFECNGFCGTNDLLKAKDFKIYKVAQRGINFADPNNNNSNSKQPSLV